MNLRHWMVLGYGLSALIAACTTSPVATGGSSSETVIGTAVDSNGNAVANAAVTVRARDYVTPLSSLGKSAFRGILDATTNANGRFVLDSLTPGSYVVEINDGASACVARSVDIAAVGRTVTADPDTLRPYAVIRGSVDTTVSSGGSLRVQVRGLERIADVDAQGQYTIPDMPRGVFSLRIASPDTTVTTMDVDSVRTTAGTTTVVGPFAGWRYSRRVYLNTSVTGAGVTEDVHHFPTVVRLDATTFDYTQAQPDGADLRFSRPDGTPLSYEIESWDSATRTAAIWVNVDTIRGNNASQYITMHWGASTGSATPSLSNPAAVFDTALGFRGVWHLSEDAAGEGTPDLYRDATAYAAHGTDSVTSLGKDGIIGRGQQFDGSQDYIPISSDRDITDTLTVSAWIKVDYIPNDTVNRGFWILSNYGMTYPDSLTILTSGYQFGTYRNDYTFTAGNGTAPEGAGTWDRLSTSWTYLAIQWEQGTGRVLVFENGVQVVADDPVTAPDILYPAIARTYISIYKDHQFQGYIDEVEVSATRRSPAWIRLCYENQRPDQTMVHF